MVHLASGEREGGIGLVSTVKRDLLDGGHAAAQFLRFASRPTGGRP